MKQTTKFWILVAFLLAALLALGLKPGPVQFHPILVFDVNASVQITFLQHGKATQQQCDANIDRMVSMLGQSCKHCKLIASHCTKTLDPLQRKILNGQPVDAPVLRVNGGAIAFSGAAADLALQTCIESERKGANSIAGGARCAPAAVENLALALGRVNSNKPAAPALDLKALTVVAALAIGIAFLVSYLIIISECLHGRFSGDGTDSGPQKFHATRTPRIGGIALAASMAGSLALLTALQWLTPSALEGVILLALSAIPAFAGGLGEDLTKRVGVLMRLALTISAAIAASFFVGATLDRLDVPGLDIMMQWPIFAIAFTAIAVGGVANAINIIDGYHGLAGGYSILVLCALAIVAAQVGDPVVLAGSVMMAGALAGLLAWNYPKGKIFLGDGGAYLLGFWLAELSVLLVTRNPAVSPWFPMVLLIYPVFETCFSMYRRKLIRGKNPGHPDALHLHQLIYLRLSRISVGSRNATEITRRNSLVARYIWSATAVFILAALTAWRSTAALVCIAAVFCVAYLWLYIRLVRWRAPSWMIASEESPVQTGGRVVK